MQYRKQCSGLKDFYKKIGDLRSGCKEELVRHSGGNLDDVARANSSLFAPLYTGALNLVRCGDNRIDDLSTRDQRGTAGLNHHNIGLVLVELRTAVLLAVRDGENMIPEIHFLRDTTSRHALGPR